MPPPAPALNDRQRAYLLAVFETDQETEQQVRELPYRPFQPPRPKASEWRWLEYAEPVPILGREGSPLWTRIKKLALVDQGTGSTFSALADRHLVEVRWHHLNVHGQGTPHLRMTTKGRQLARSWTGVKAYKAPPAGTLKEWHWRALAKAYAAGDEGLKGEYGVYAPHRRQDLAATARVQAGRARRGASNRQGQHYGVAVAGSGAPDAHHRKRARAVPRPVGALLTC